MRKTIVIFLLVIILPTFIFLIYQIGTLRENEQVIEGIYNNQLDAILFSVNQYSADAVSSLASQIVKVLSDQTGVKKDRIESLIKEYPSISLIIQYDADKKLITCIPDSLSYSTKVEKIKTILDKNDTTLERLKSYLNAGYPKIQSFALDSSAAQLMVFLSKTEKGIWINTILLDPDKFIRIILDPKIQEIAQDKFYISAYNKAKDKIIYTSDKKNSTVKITHFRPFWLINNYYIGIELKNQTITDLAKTRSIRNIYLVAFIDLILLLGAWMIYRNIKKQMELSQLKSDFVSNVSHEIRTPLALISMYIETLEMGRIISEEKVKDYYSVILHESQRLSGIVNKILNFSQIESGKRKYSMQKATINDIVGKVCNTFKISLENKGFKCSVEYAPDIPQIFADPEAIADALVNLIDNAIKYSNENKEIAVRTGSMKDEVFIEVEDHGIGISEKEQKHIFDKFYRVTEKNLAYRAKGSGLGLAIVKHIMNAHNGKIIVKSIKNQGSDFKLIFPINLVREP
jgi:two-component system, OmpR family, phosphate regulon sensor histidine kinase PhoR